MSPRPAPSRSAVGGGGGRAALAAARADALVQGCDAGRSAAGSAFSARVCVTALSVSGGIVQPPGGGGGATPAETRLGHRGLVLVHSPPPRNVYVMFNGFSGG